MAKYIVTAIVISGIFGNLSDEKYFYLLGGLSVVITMTFGLLLLKDEDSSKSSKIKKRK